MQKKTLNILYHIGITAITTFQEETTNRRNHCLYNNLLIDFSFVNFSTRFTLDISLSIHNYLCFIYLFRFLVLLAHYNQDFHMHVCINISIDFAHCHDCRNYLLLSFYYSSLFEIVNVKRINKKTERFSSIYAACIQYTYLHIYV